MEDDSKWVTLPMVLQDFADRTFAKYQLDVFEARKKFEKGSLSQQKLKAVEEKATIPLVLMHGSGQPATGKYIKDHMFADHSGNLKLKDRCFLYINRGVQNRVTWEELQNQKVNP